MLILESRRPVRFCDGMTRRDFLRIGGLTAGAVGLTLSELRQLGASDRASAQACILLFLVGGPSHLDTFDPKPQAPTEVRGPFRPIATRVPGIHITELFPQLAARMDRLALVRTVYHQEAAVHEAGHQLMQTGRLCCWDCEYPHYGAVVSKLLGQRFAVPPFAVVPGPIGNTGICVSHGQGAGFLGAEYEPIYLAPHLPQTDLARLDTHAALLHAFDQAQRHLTRQGSTDTRVSWLTPALRQALKLESEPPSLRQRYGYYTFGQSCLLARRLIEAGVRLVTVNMFETVYDTVTWDCHADGASLGSTLEDYRRTLGPMLDQTLSALLDDLATRGLLESTLVVALGEFGRTPMLNPRGGRDHHIGAWTILFAGGGIRGGVVVGRTDSWGMYPEERPVSAMEVAATVYQALGISPRTRLRLPNGTLQPLADAEPIWELFPQDAYRQNQNLTAERYV
ncbi:MAG: DUF1501 domain-containing protein [Gemmatales bacterium]|nr:DUF1501 domain-containing protein [Gemmatales bacterium]MDW7995490.1 DUF1501 domain-containing protein [Gemmatales bacterium]